MVAFASLAIVGPQRLTHFDSGLLISRTFLPRAGSSCTFFFFVFSVLCTKNALKRAQFSRYSTTFLTILHISSELCNNWGTGLPCLLPSWIYCAGKQHKASLFPCLFSSFPPLFTVVASWIILIIRTSPALPHLHHYITISPECWLLFFQVLAFLERSCGMPLLALIVP